MSYNNTHGPDQSCIQPSSPQYFHHSEYFIPYAVPVSASPMAPPPDLDYMRPQTWRNLPQQQDRARNTTSADQSPIYEMDQPHRCCSRDTRLSCDSTTQISRHREPASAFMSDVVAIDATDDCASSHVTRDSVDTAVETMWEARRLREKAEEEADQKLLDAVCKASLAEYKERERVLMLHESESSQRLQHHHTSSEALQQARSEAETRKRAAVQTVIDSKARANQMREKAREASLLYEQKNHERLLKEAELEALKLREVQEAEILAMQKRKEEAARNRAEAEQKAREAREKAEIMRCKAFEAASKVRANSRRQIEIQLTEEEAQRQREMQRKLDEIEKNKELAHQRREAAVKKAEEARRRAEELNLKAQHARAGLKSSVSAAS
ncbi:hypothetical protein PsorP6_008308 [Peronosclerospora sorghi]|uniref:Uncharacterized protein n=1 Tax=Peronosclerospora sorghi TaxID=230839 RepID=A0ACC0WBB2_9STRA|nr:hypothetical protein PsorP6_008308 [Peronosclerospora sorghi]